MNERLEDHCNPDDETEILISWYKKHHDHQGLADAYSEAWKDYISAGDNALFGTHIS